MTYLRGFLDVTAFAVVEIDGTLFWQTDYANGDIIRDPMPTSAAVFFRQRYGTFPVSARRLVDDGVVSREALRDKIGMALP